MMATSGFAFSIHSLDFSKPENTRFQYGSSVRPLSIAAPIAGTCDDATPAMILATFGPRLAANPGFRLGRRLRLRARLGLGLALRLGTQVGARSAAIAFHRSSAGEHHLGVVV